MRTVVVGASSGLGRCIGIGLARRGGQVALLARRTDRLEGTVAEAGNGAVAIECDVTDAERCARAIDDAAEALGGIDALVYTPGIGPLARIEATDAETWGRVFETNVTGAALVTAAALPHLEASGGRAGRASGTYRVEREGRDAIEGRIVFGVVRDRGQPRIALIAVTPAS